MSGTNGQDCLVDQAGEDVPGCCICEGGTAAPCCVECRHIDTRRKAAAEAKGLGVAVRRCWTLFRRFRGEGDGLGSPRLVAALARFGELREKRRKALKIARGA